MKSKSFIKLFTLNLKVVRIIIVIGKFYISKLPSFQASKLLSSRPNKGGDAVGRRVLVVQSLAARNTTHLPLISCSLSKLQVTTAVGQYPRDHFGPKTLKITNLEAEPEPVELLGGCGEGMLGGWGRAASLD